MNKYMWYIVLVLIIIIVLLILHIKKEKDRTKLLEDLIVNTRKQISTVDSKKLLMEEYQSNTSNIMRVLDHYPELRRKR